MSNKANAAVYSRVSTGEQVEGTSLQSQRDACLKQAATDGFEVLPKHLFEDAGISGAKDEDERPGFRALMEAARSRQFSTLYIQQLDRLGRDQEVIVRALRGLAQHGVEVISLKDPPLMNALVRGVLTGLAEYERDVIRERTSRGREARRAEGVWTQGMAPYGLRRRADGFLEWDDVEAPILHDIFARSIAGDGRIRIVADLNEKGVLPPVVELKMPGRDRTIRLRTNDPKIGSSRSRLADYIREAGAAFASGFEPKWNESGIHKIQTNTTYTGKSTDGSPVKILPAPLVSEEMYRRAQGAAASRNRVGRAPRDAHIAAGLLRCGVCGRGLVPATVGQRKGKPGYPRYVCHGRRNHNGCQLPVIKRDEVHAFIAQRVAEHLTHRIKAEDLRAQLLAAGQRRADELAREHDDAKREVADFERRHKEAFSKDRALRALGVGDVGLEPLAAELQEIEAGITAARRRVEIALQGLADARQQHRLDADRVEEVVELAEESLQVGDDRPPPELRGLLPDPHPVIQRIVKKVIIRSPADFEIQFDETEEAVADAIRLVLADASQITSRHHAYYAKRRLDEITIEPGAERTLMEMLQRWVESLRSRDANVKPLA